MAIMGFNAGAEMSQLRTQQTLAMQAAAPGTPGVPAAGATEQTAAMAAGAAAPTSGAADAAVAGAAVQEPPASGKIVLQSVLKGAMTGASVALGFKQFGPLLGKIGPIGKFFGSLPKVGPPPVLGTGVLGFLGKLPIVGKLLPLAARSGLAGFAIAALIGAGIGAIGGLISGRKKAKAAAAEYAEAMAAQQAQTPPPGDPVNVPPTQAPAPAPTPLPASVRGRRAKSWIISRQGATSKTGGSFGSYTAHKGDTALSLAKRFHTSVVELKRLNPDMGDKVDPGMTLKVKRRVVPNAKAWVA